jgi:hypothetical protein
MKYEVIPFMSLSLFNKMKESLFHLINREDVKVKIEEDRIKNLIIPSTLIALSKEHGLQYDELISMILVEFHNRMNDDINIYSKDIINLIQNFDDITKDQKEKLTVFLLKNLKLKD